MKIILVCLMFISMNVMADEESDFNKGSEAGICFALNKVYLTLKESDPFSMLLLDELKPKLLKNSAALSKAYKKCPKPTGNCLVKHSSYFALGYAQGLQDGENNFKNKSANTVAESRIRYCGADLIMEILGKMNL